MSYRRSNNLSKFFPDRYTKSEEADYKESRRPYTNHRKDIYVPSSSHKDIFIPNGNSHNPEKSGRAYPPVRPAYRDERSNRSLAYARSEKTLSPSQNSPASSLRTPPVSNSANHSQYSTPESSTVDNNDNDTSLWKKYNETKYKDQTHMLTSTGEYQLSEKTLSQLHKPAYKIIYDPELSKNSDKGKQAISQKLDMKNFKSKDPRKENSSKSSSSSHKRFKKIPFKSLPLPKLIYDKNSIGGPPPNEIVISGLARAFNEIYLRNEVKKHGEVLEFENVMDPTTGIPLGILRIRYGGSHDRAYRSVRKAVSDLNETTIEGRKIQAGMNREGKLLQSLKTKAIQERELKIKKMDLIEKKISLPSAPKAVLNAISKSKGLPQKEKPQQQVKPHTQIQPDTSSPIPKEPSSKSKKDDFIVPQELDKYVKGRPFIYIAAKYVKGQVEKNDIKKALETYDWTRVLYDPSGVYIVFNSAKEAHRCFQFENGKKVLSVNLYMEVHLPESYKLEASDEKYAHTQRDVIEESTSLLAKELEAAVQKDIRTKIIAPAVLKLLNIENFPDLKPKLAPAPPPARKPTVETIGSVVSPLNKDVNPSIDVFSLQRKVPKVASPNDKEASLGKKKSLKSKKKRALPMSYRLNFEDESESDFRESTVSTPQLESYYKDEEDEERDKEGPPKKKIKVSNRKERLPLLYSSSSEEDEGEEEDENKKSKDSQPTTPETPQEDKMDIDTKSEPKDEMVPKIEEEVDEVVDDSNVDYSALEKQFRPTPSEFPIPVYDDDKEETLDINGIQNVIKDEEDFKLLKELFLESPPTTVSQYPDYMLWKLKSTKTVTEASKSEIIDAPNFLINSTGSHRSEGYSKISDELKVEYLPHKRRVHDPLSTVQVENEDNDSSKVQSSRVNRANNRRFAYEVSTFNNQNEILTLNQLNKRKKPVSFARSAIHNWGLYALEPIAQKEMIIEYVGERIRQQVADFREKAYLKSGIGSSYLFRIDENTVIDATKKGGIARFINHCCQPSCTAKIIKVEGQKRIVIYALRDIGANEELTYDYKFERETNDNERVRCLCGAPGCKGYLN
ncbi:Histone-lysine N-methyltransferase [Wickerhamomyces ciferrii]|uniref:Histone-lysine N-methyltransferase, H3 lysine-4 specific n=1 Tax=Wickerhamomyces ciferrii (strain ATCC 14091 / BCRC 22168 / CBS 111 / JCM 3599 / NBRC 0793 / NRRL Y-1031 F-60-10) TaxID=1206466 RepID=K0KFE8_WICCF|nr:Histone-lysine N-methyltransferase [Wickerhamomyces ciferrii]CCH40952.1 Histone-lysine N-methyltransferase [Wickerhamomyces ciferrii]